MGGVDEVIPVDVYVPGCAPRPEAIINGVAILLKKLQPDRAGEIDRLLIEAGGDPTMSDEELADESYPEPLGAR